MFPNRRNLLQALARMKKGDMEAALCMLDRAWEVKHDTNYTSPQLHLQP